MESGEALLSDLTPEQREAVVHVDGPLLIIAGAGSGKTRVITRRVARLLSLGIEPSSILAITFTNKAAGEMKSRIGAAMDRPLRDFGQLDQRWPLICTFHSLGMRILKHYADRIGIPRNFTIYDSSDTDKVMKQAVAAAELSITNYPVAACRHAISNAKNKLVSAETYAAGARDFYSQNVARVYKHYQRILDTNHAMDFDDLLMKTAHAFRDHRHVLEDLQQRFQYILIDEYQDTNFAQYVIANRLADKHKNICVVGDPDQSIYSWRGADIRNILDFEKDYPGARVLLEQNYRSTQSILNIASKLISYNRQRKEKRLIGNRGEGGPAKLLLCGDEHEEASAIARELKSLHDKEGIDWNRMAVFYRINSLSRVMEDALRRSNMPYRIARGVDFYHRKEIKDVLAYLRVVVNPDDELSLERIINVPARGISDPTVRSIREAAAAKQWSLWQALRDISQVSSIPARAAASIRTFVQLVERWRQLAAIDPAKLPPGADGLARGRIQSVMEEVVRGSGYEAYLSKQDDEESSTLANVSELISSAREFDETNPQATLEDYLGQVSLVSDVDTLDERGGAITLMTLHAAKGLEFPAVAMIAMEEGVLPHARVRDHPEQVEEERRLCFVGITRAQEHLIFSRAENRMFRGRRERTAASRFLAEMPPTHLQVLDAMGETFSDDQGARARAELESERLADAFSVGQMVRHRTFGVGKIVDLANMGQQTRAIVQFQGVGQKTLILQYANLETVR